jgi:antitoxin component YwqK of YwqJK toxin-antitoxin module
MNRPAAIILTAVFAAACKNVALSPCPDGAKPMGAAPPNGQEKWCEKLDANGHPVKHGLFTLYWPNGTKMLEGTYLDGKQDGLWTRFYPSGQRLAVDEYRSGAQEGRHVGWYPNGNESEEGQYHDGKREGRWHKWDEAGLKNWFEEYRADKRVS